MVDPNSLLEQLNKLTDSQREELLFRFDVDEAHLRTGVTKNQQNIDLIRLFQQQESGLHLLQNALREFAFFKGFIPAGTYPVGDELRQREEAREQDAMQAAATRGDAPEYGKITPEKFYSFQRGTEWLGVFRQWDGPRSFRADLLETTIRNSRNRRNCPATAIIGHGGCGKSVALRRLALDLAEEGYKVWWAESPERLVEFGLDDFIDNENKPQFLLIDEIQDLDSSYVERLRRHLKKYPFLVLVVAGRSLPRELRLGTKDQFTPNEAADRVIILDKIAEVLPGWATAASQLKAESLREVRLVRILVVLARRQDPVPQTLEELEEVFLQILVDDLERIREQFPGLATAIVDGAVFREVGIVSLHRCALIALANYHQPHANIPTLFEQVTSNRRWDLLTSLLSFEPTQNYLLFHHAELAEGLLQASQEGLIEPYVDNAYRRAILETSICLAVNSKGDTEISREIAEVSSELLRCFFYQLKNLVDPTIILDYIYQLLNAEVPHYAYFSLVVEDILDLTQEKRLEIFLIAARLVPRRQIGNNTLWRSVLEWVQDSYPENIQDKIFQQLYQAGCQSFVILNEWLQLLPRGEAKEKARVLLTTPGQAHQVLCSCLALLGEEAKEEARALLTTPGQDQQVLCSCLELLGKEAKEEALVLLTTPGQAHQVLCSCLALLGEEAKEEALVLLTTLEQNPKVLCSCLALLGEEAKTFAQEKIKSWAETNSVVLARCFAVAGDTPEAEKAAEEILLRWQAGKKLTSAHKIVALRAPFDTELRTEMALQVLKNWRAEYRPLVTSAFTAFWNDPDAVTDYCRQILRRWDGEIEYQHRNRHKNYRRRHDGHIIKALAHPSLRRQARAAAKRMLQREKNAPGFLTPLLHQRAVETTQGQFPLWTGEEEETEPLQTHQMAVLRPPKVSKLK